MSKLMHPIAVKMHPTKADCILAIEYLLTANQPVNDKNIRKQLRDLYLEDGWRIKSDLVISATAEAWYEHLMKLKR